MTLESVPFRKGRAQAPRLSAPYVPGRRSERFWSDAELDVVRKHYVRHGAAYCLARLPGRTAQSVYLMARKLELSRGSNRVRSSYRLSYDLIDARIRAAWPELAGKGALTDFAAKSELPRWLVSKRAQIMGLSMPHRKEPPWTAAEEALLRRAPIHDPSRAADMFGAHGFHRTPTSIVVRCKRIGLSRRHKATLSARSAADILGVDNKTMANWCLEGLVKSARRGTKRLPQQGGDWHSITRAALRQFVIDNLDRLDIRKVDKHAFVDLLVRLDAPAEPPAAGGG